MAQSVLGIAYPRATLIGNPSDGFGGKTIAFVFSDFHAEVHLGESDRIQVIPGLVDHLDWKDLSAFRSSVSSMGYYGGLRLLKATLLVFIKHCEEQNITLHKRGFKLSYTTNIPLLLGLSGSSAIIAACLRALGSWYEIKLESWQLADLAWRVETEELRILAGLQDRVAQAYNHPVFMDFDKGHFNDNPYGKYEKITVPLNNIYIAYSNRLAKGAAKIHSELLERFEFGDTHVLEAMESWKNLTVSFREALEKDDFDTMNECININFDIRNKLVNLHPEQVELVMLARQSGASSKFCGSGGAIIGMYKDEETLKRLRSDLAKAEVNILLPNIVYST